MIERHKGLLAATFCHIPGVGAKMERRLWDHGVRSWQRALETGALCWLSPAKADLVRQGAERSLEALAADRLSYFLETMPPSERFRLYGPWRHQAVSLDVETGGDELLPITVASAFNGERMDLFMAGQDLDRLAEALRDATILLTFNGSAFDIPLVRQALGDVALPPLHIDLKALAGRLRLWGGLKRVEEALGVLRHAEAAVLPGLSLDPIVLWRHWQETRDNEALRLLLLYNAEDTLNLFPVMDRLHNTLAERLGLEEGVPVLDRGEFTYDISLAILSRLAGLPQGGYCGGATTT